MNEEHHQHTREPIRKERDFRGQGPFQDLQADRDAETGRTKAARALARFDRAGARGGRKRWKTTSMNGGTSGSRSLPDEWLAASLGYRFSRAEETPSQGRALTKVVVDYLQRRTLARYRDLSCESLAAAIGLTGPTVRKRLAERLPYDEIEADFVLTCGVLREMFFGKIAGPLAIRKTADSDWLLRKIFYGSFGDRMDWPEIGEGAPYDVRNLWNAFKLDYHERREEDES